MFEARVINLCDRYIATNFGAVAGEVILVDSCACTVILVSVIVIYISKKKKRETEFLLAVLLFTCRSGTVEDKIVCGIRFLGFFAEVKRRSKQD